MTRAKITKLYGFCWNLSHTWSGK